jgi:hypothetical protein
MRSPTRRERKRRKAAQKLEALRARMKAGVDALERGDFIEVNEADLDHFLAGLSAIAKDANLRRRGIWVPAFAETPELAR